MAEYLEKEAFKSWMKENITQNSMILTAIDYAPSADVELVRHGCWEKHSVSMMVCSLCGKHTAKHNFKYCPNCGARMDGSEEYQ
jgi:hypothetical protein